MTKAHLGAVGVSAIALVSVFASCGGKVVVDGTSSSGGGDGGAGGSGQQQSSAQVGTSVGQGDVASAGPGSGPDTSVGQGSTGSGGGFPSARCEQCLDKVASGVCELVADACDASPQCQAHLDCLDSCDFTYECEAKCSQTFPSMEYFDLINCLICQNCLDPCIDFTLAQYCLDTG